MLNYQRIYLECNRWKSLWPKRTLRPRSVERNFRNWHVVYLGINEGHRNSTNKKPGTGYILDMFMMIYLDMFMVRHPNSADFHRFPTSLQLPSSCRMTLTSTLTSRHKQSQTQLLDSGLNGCNCEQGIAPTSLGCNATAAFCKQ